MITIKIKQFGQALASRIEGREAALSTIAYQLNGTCPKEITLDFEGVLIMTPSWLGEYLQTLQSRGVNKFNYINTSPTVDSSLEFVESEISK